MLTRRQVIAMGMAFAGTHVLSACGLKTVSQEADEAAEAKEAQGSVAGQSLTVAVTDPDIEDILAEYVTPILGKDDLKLMTRLLGADELDKVLEQTSSGVVDVSLAASKSQVNRYLSKNAGDLVVKEPVFYRPFGIYSNNLDTPHLAPYGASVGLPNDLVGQGHALQFMSGEGLVTLADAGALAAKVTDVVENPFGFAFNPMPANELVDALDVLDFCVIDFENAHGGGLRAKDACVIESSDAVAAQYYGPALVIKSGLTSDARVLALLKCLRTKDLNEWMYHRYLNDLIQVAIDE